MRTTKNWVGPEQRVPAVFLESRIYKTMGEMVRYRWGWVGRSGTIRALLVDGKRKGRRGGRRRWWRRA